MSIRRRPLPVHGRARTLALAVVVSAAAVTPLGVAGVRSLHGTAVEITPTAASPAPTGETEVALAGAPAATGVDTDVAGGGQQVKEITSPTPFSMIGVTWKGRHDDAKATVRARQADGTWGPWYTADAVDGGSTHAKVDARGGTEPIFLGTETTAVQISVSGVDVEASSPGTAPTPATSRPTPAANGDIAGASSPASPTSAAPIPATSSPTAPIPTTSSPSVPARPADSSSGVPPLPVGHDAIRPVAQNSPLAAGVTASPSDVKAVLLSPSPQAAAAPTEQYGDTSAEITTGGNRNIAVSKPGIVSRSGWGADESIRCSSPYYDDGLAAGVVHHTAGSNNYSQAQSAGIVRGIYTYHAVNLGWCDVGYHTLVDKYGTAYEGAYGGLDKPVEGAHTGGFNANTFGISMMGDYSSVQPSDATIKKVGEVLGWRLGIAGIDPKGKATHYSEGTSYTFIGQGQAVNLPNIFAHRDVGLTTCPGDSGYAQMNRIRDIAKSYSQGQGGGTSSPGTSTTKPTTPPSGGGTTSPGTTSPETPAPSTDGAAGSAADPKAGAVALITDLLKKALSGQKIDAGSLTSLLTAGLKLKDIGVSPGAALTAAQGGDISALWTALQAGAGPLGKALSGIQKFGNVSYTKFENGAIYQGPDAAPHALWGRIGDAWAGQGYERGPLGLPVAEEEKRADGVVAQRFEHGTIVFSPATGLITVEPGR